MVPVLPLAAIAARSRALALPRNARPSAASGAETGPVSRAERSTFHGVPRDVRGDHLVRSDQHRVLEWLQRRARRRFNVPVRYVLYSHHHWDHASGGAVFADTAEFVGHEMMPAKLGCPLGARRCRRRHERRRQPQWPHRARRSHRRVSTAVCAIRRELRWRAQRRRGRARSAQRGASGRALFEDQTTVTLGGQVRRDDPHRSDPFRGYDRPAFSAAACRVFLVDFISLKRLPFRNLPGGMTLSFRRDDSRGRGARLRHGGRRSWLGRHEERTWPSIASI